MKKVYHGKRGIAMFILGIWILITSCADSVKVPPRQFHSWTSDVIFLDSTRYLMDRSPLYGLGGYEYLLPIGVTMIDPPDPPGTIGNDDKKYAAIWTLVDSMLYLRAIDGIRTVPRVYMSTQYIPEMKKFLISKKAVKKAETPLDKTPIRAAWVTGLFYVKKAVDKPGEFFDLGAWRKSPFQELTFDEGKLVSVREIETLPVTEDDEKEYQKKLIENRENRGKVNEYMERYHLKYLDLYDDNNNKVPF